MSTKSIVVLGASYAGASTAHYLLQHALPALPQSSAYQVVLVSASAEILCRPACPRAMISDDFFDQTKLFVPVGKAFERYSKTQFRFVHGAATQLDHTARVVTVSPAGGGPAEKLDYHALVIATGASTVSPLLSMNKDSSALKADWAAFRKDLSSAKSIVIAGGGPAGVESAGELGEYLNGRAGMFSSRLERPKVPITLVTSGQRILPLLRPGLAEKAERLLAKVGVTVIKNTTVTKVSPDGAGTDGALGSAATVTLSDGKTLTTDLYIPATGTKPNTSFIAPALLTADGRVDTDASTLRVEKAGPRVYAVGDVGSYSRPAVHHILTAIPIVCANVKRDLLLAASQDGGIGDVPAAKEDRKFVEDKRETQLVPVGKSKGVGAVMGWALPSLLVWAIKGRDYWLWTTGNLWNGKQWAKES